MGSIRLARAGAQLLHRPLAPVPEALVRRLLAVQAQGLRHARLALRARSEGLTAAAVDSALGDRSLVAGWLMRGTLHLVARDDYPWLLGLTAPTRLAAGRRRLRQEGVAPADAERAVAVVEQSLAAEGPLTRAELAERIAVRGIRTEGQATPHLLMVAALRGVAVLGPPRGDGAQAFALARDWLGAAPPAELAGEARDAALAELARRYLAAHGPAGERDLASWSGLPLRDARAGLRRIASELVEAGGGMWDLERREPPPRAVAPRLLPAFDPYMLGWRGRGFAVAEPHARRVHPGGGMLRAVATDGGLVVGTWSARRQAARLAVEISPFERLAPAVAAALESEAADVARFEGLDSAA